MEWLKGIGNSVKQQVTAFRLLYFSVALYTLRHSAIGFATIEQKEGVDLWPLLAALILDIGMLLAAERLRVTFSWWLVSGLLLSAVGSAYTQLLFGVTNAQDVVIAPGAEWAQAFAAWIIEKRVILLPVIMPFMVIIYAFASKVGVSLEEDTISDGNALRQTQSIALEGEVLPPALSDGNEEVPTIASNGHSKKELVRILRETYPDWTYQRLAEEAGCSTSTVSKALRE